MGAATAVCVRIESWCPVGRQRQERGVMTSPSTSQTSVHERDSSIEQHVHKERVWLWAIVAGIFCPCHSVPIVLALAATGTLARFRPLLAIGMVLVFAVLLVRAGFFTKSSCKECRTGARKLLNIQRRG